MKSTDKYSLVVWFIKLNFGTPLTGCNILSTSFYNNLHAALVFSHFVFIEGIVYFACLHNVKKLFLLFSLKVNTRFVQEIFL